MRFSRQQITGAILVLTVLLIYGLVRFLLAGKN